MQNVTRYEPNDEWSMDEASTGRFVSYDDYMEMSNYADRLVAHKNMVCLPMDLQILRESNLALAVENEALRKEIGELKEKSLVHKARVMGLRTKIRRNL